MRWTTMQRYLWQSCYWLGPVAAFVLLWPALPARAQDPFAEAAVVGEEKPAADGEEAAGDEVDPDDPIVRSIRESNPTTPDDLMRAVETLLRIGARTEAKKYLKQLTDSKPAPPVLAELLNEFGTGAFLRISREEAFQPEGFQLAQAALDAATQQARDPARIDALIKDLSSPDDGLRRSAVLDLRKAQDAAVNPLLKVLADPSRAAEHRYVRWGLTQLREPALEPLIGALQTPDDPLKAQVIEVLGDMRAQRATLYLVRPFVAPDSDPALRRAAEQALMKIVGRLPDPRDAKRFLLRQAESSLAGAMPLVPDHNGLVTLWHWNPEQKEVFPLAHLAADAAQVVAGQAASELYLLEPQNPLYRRLYLMAMLSSAKVVAGLDRRLPAGPGTVREMAQAMGKSAVEDVLVRAMRDGHFAAAIGAAEVLGDFGDADLLAGTDGQARPLADALRHPNRRLRAAAADAIMRIDPTSPYAGSSRLPETLGFLAGTVGLRRALVGHPRPSEAQTLVGMLIDTGFAADTANSGRDTFLKAVASPDYEFVLISDALDLPPLTELLQMLRRDRRTASLPVGMMVRVERLDTLKDEMSLDPLTEVFPQPQDDASMNFQVRRLLARAGRHLVPDQERVMLAAMALDHLATLAAERDKYAMYDVLRQENSVEAALYVPELSARAAKVLGLIGSPQAQQSLVDFASQTTLPVELRQSAADAFAEAVKRRGVLLTTGLITRQYDRYNESETLSVDTQQLLGSILDTIEAAPGRNDPQKAEAAPHHPTREDQPG